MSQILIHHSEIDDKQAKHEEKRVSVNVNQKKLQRSLSTFMLSIQLIC